MHDDDRNLGRLLGRREALAWLGAGAWSMSSLSHAADTAACVVRPEQTEGPFFVDERLERVDIRPDPATGATSPGAPLRLAIAVSTMTGGTCVPVRGATVDVWQCDAAGRYSDVRDFAGSTVGQKFLRGFQKTDERGLAQFVTIVPGWYEGRAVHIHFRIDTPPAGARARTFASQLYFEESLLDRVYAQAPYATRTGRRVRNAQDGLFRRGGEQLMLAPRPEGDALATRFNVGLA
jgi:protocatechuate 3,4-dioxygenase beta subunit